MISCGILGTTVLGFVGAGCFSFEIFEPIRGVSRGWGDERGCNLGRFPENRYPSPEVGLQPRLESRSTRSMIFDRSDFEKVGPVPQKLSIESSSYIWVS